MKNKIIDESPVAMSEVKAALERTKEKEGELNFRANKTYEYLSKITVLPEDRANELKAALEGLDVSRLKDAQVVKLLDVLPTTEEEVKHVLQHFTLSVSAENRKKIAEEIQKVVSTL